MECAEGTGCPMPEEETGTASKRPRPRGPAPGRHSTWDGWSWVDDQGNRRPENQRAQDKNARRRPPEAQARNAEKERERKKRVKEARLKEEQQRLEQQLLAGVEESAAGGAESPPPSSPPVAGADVHEKDTQLKLTRDDGYDTTNNLNKLLTQGFNCSIPERNKKNLFHMLIKKINALEEHGVMSKHQGIQVGTCSVVDVLRLVRKELECKEPNAKRHDYSTDFRKQLKDVLLSTLGTETVGLMEKEVTMKVEPEEGGNESLMKENTLLKRKIESQDLLVETQAQIIAQLIIQNELLAMQPKAEHFTTNLSDMNGFNLNEFDKSSWPGPSMTASVKSEGGKTTAYGRDGADDIWGDINVDTDPNVKGKWM